MKKPTPIKRDYMLALAVRGALNHLDDPDVPKHMINGIRTYLEHGIPPGSFLRAFLEGDLFKAAMHADQTNQIALFILARWVLSYMPIACYGSPERVEAWVAGGGVPRKVRDAMFELRERQRLVEEGLKEGGSNE